MAKYFYSLMFLMIISCNQNPSQADKDYIKNLEDKNKILEKELLEAKSKTGPTNIVQEKKQKSESSTDYFTIGSSEDEVLRVMGQPTTDIIIASETRMFSYGSSAVYFYQDKVISYDNPDHNLKVRVK